MLERRRTRVASDHVSGEPQRHRAFVPLLALGLCLAAGLLALAVASPAARALPLPGDITGTVTNATSSNLVNIDVTAYQSDGSGGWDYVNDVTTGSDGKYDFGSLSAGTYRLQFYDYSGTYLPQYYANKADLESATDVVVSAGATTSGINATLALAGHISGTISAPGTVDLTNVDVRAYQSDGSGGWNYVNDVNAASDGSYDLGGLASGTYRLRFRDYSGTCVTQYYANKGDLDSATDVTVTAPLTTSGINVTLVLSGHISGTISAPGATDLSNVDVTAYQSDGSGGWNYVNDVSAASDGTYDLNGLATGTYRVEFDDYSGNYLMQCYHNKASLDAADNVSVTAGATTSGVNATLLEAGHIIGLVTNASSHGLGGISVTAYQADGSGGWNYVSGATTTSGGSYDVGGLASGNYRLEFQDNSGTYAMQYYAGKTDVASAADIAVTAGITTPNINATLAAAGHITGNVGVAHITVSAYLADGHGGWNFVSSSGDSASDGSYTLDGLPGGTYRIEFEDQFNGYYATQYYNNKASLAAADDVSVTGGATTSGIDATMVPPGPDATPPTTTVTGADALWHNAQVNLTLSATDNVGGSGMSGGAATTEYKIGSGSWTVGTTVPVPAPANHSGDGAQTILYKSCDAAGNWETAKSVTVKIDTTAPAGGFTLNGGAATTTTPAVTVGSAVSDANGVSGMRFSTDGKASWSSWASYNASVALTLPAGNGAKTVWAQYEDPAGNVFVSSAAITLAVPTPTSTLTLKLSGLKSGALKFGKSVTAKGTVTPTSLAGSKVVLVAQLKKGAKWVKAKTFAALITSTGAYSWKYKPARKGAYRLQAAIAKTATHAATTTKWLAFKVK